MGRPSAVEWCYNCVGCFEEGVGEALIMCIHCTGIKEETGRKVISP